MRVDFLWVDFLSQFVVVVYVIAALGAGVTRWLARSVAPLELSEEESR